jgi:hypothetical protein
MALLCLLVWMGKEKKKWKKTSQSEREEEGEGGKDNGYFHLSFRANLSSDAWLHC